MFDEKKIREMERRAGVQLNIRMFYFLLTVPLILIFYNPLLSLVSLFTVLELPKVILWFLIKERKRRMMRELPLVAFSLSWLVDVYPVPVAVSRIKGGEYGKVFGRVYERYRNGEDFESALNELEPEELRQILLHVFRTGRGKELLKGFARRKSSEYRSFLRDRGARLQLYSTVFVTVSTVLPAITSAFSAFSGSSPALLQSALASLGVWLLWKIQD